MKKITLMFVSLAIAATSFAQDAKEIQALSAEANPSLSLAQKATLEWVKTYDLSAEQAAEALHIQQAKYRNFADIAPIKGLNSTLYVQKRLAAMDIAENELAMQLDNGQMKIFKQQQTVRAGKLESITAVMKKEGATENAIRQRLADADF